MSGRHYAPGRRAQWQIWVISADGERLIFHAACEDRRECVALASAARHASTATRIFFINPASGEQEAYD